MARKSRKNLPVPETPAVKGMKIWRAALYIRLSVEFNSNRGDSLETQRQIMEAALARYPEIEISGIYTDNGITGRTFERPAFQHLLEDIEAGKIDCVVVKDLSRLGRNTIDTGFYIEKYFPLHNVRFIAVNDGYDSENETDNGTHITIPIKNMMNEIYAADISRKVKSQAHQSMKDGEFIGARPPYGYKKDPDNCHKLIVNEDTAPIVRQIFEWTLAGTSLNVVVKRLNESEIMTPGYYLASCGIITGKKLNGNGKWQTWTVAKILTDEVYTGDMVQGKTKIVEHKQVPTPPEEWIVVRGTHKPLISREMFEKVQIIRAQAAAKYTSTTKEPYTENILRGRIFCGCCGKNMHRQRKHAYYLYHCISNDRIGKDTCAVHPRIRENDLFNVILTIICQEAKTVIGKNLKIKQKDVQLSAQKAETVKTLSGLQRELETNRKFLISLYENLITGILTTEEYISLKSGYENKISALSEQIVQLQERQKELERQIEEYSCLADRLAAVSKYTKLTSLLVNQLIERVTVNSSKDISIRFCFESGFERLWEALGDA